MHYKPPHPLSLDFPDHVGRTALHVQAALQTVGATFGPKELPRLDYGMASGGHVETWDRCLLVLELVHGELLGMDLLEVYQGRYRNATVLILCSPSASLDELRQKRDEVVARCDMGLADDDIQCRAVETFIDAVDAIREVWEPGTATLFLGWQSSEPSLICPNPNGYNRDTLERSLTWELDIPIVVMTPLLFCTPELVSQYVEELRGSRNRV